MRFAVVVAGFVLASSACGREATSGGDEAKPPPAPPAAIDEDQARVLAVLNAERGARELPPVEFVSDVRPLATAAEMIRRGSPPDIALRTALERVALAESSEGRGWCVPTESLSEPQFPSVVLEDDELTLGLVVVRTNGASGTNGGSPYVVCYLVLEGLQDYHGN